MAAGLYKVREPRLSTLVVVLIYFKIASYQIKLDKRVSDLLLSIAVSIAATGEIRDADLPKILDSLDLAIRSMVDFLIELNVFIREYLNHTFARECPFLDVAHLLITDQSEP